tara:strand:+ start:3431 stop:3952 length:522 start_codon:yes stop_codon:yes gene_type:complete
MYRIAVTGHTRGFGKYMFEHLSEEGNLTSGFSRSTGYDITKRDDRNSIIRQVKDCDIFINCAQEGFNQTELLYDLFEIWGDQKKLIINIGSNARDFTNKDQPYRYGVRKLALNHASKQLGRASICKVVTVDYGFLVRDEGTTIGYDDAYFYIDIALQSYKKNHRLLEILVAHE